MNDENKKPTPPLMTRETIEAAIRDAAKPKRKESLEEQALREREAWMDKTLVASSSEKLVCRACGALLQPYTSEIGFDPVMAHYRFHMTLGQTAQWAHDGGVRYK